LELPLQLFTEGLSHRCLATSSYAHYDDNHTGPERAHSCASTIINLFHKHRDTSMGMAQGNSPN
jgi:hypothetical protein